MSASDAGWRSGEEPSLAVTAVMRVEPRSGQTTCEPVSRECGATSKRSICWSESLLSAKAIQSGREPAVRALTAMRRTMPSAPGAVEIWMVSPPGEWKYCTTFVMSIAAVSGLTLMASTAPAGVGQRQAVARTSAAARQNRRRMIALRPDGSVNSVKPFIRFSSVRRVGAARRFTMTDAYRCFRGSIVASGERWGRSTRWHKAHGPASAR